MQEFYTQSSAGTSSVEVSKVLRNTYALLAMTLTVSAIAAGVSIALNVGYGMGIVMKLIGLVLLVFVLPKTAHSSKGLFVVFAFTALFGAGIGPTISHYLALPNGGSMVMQALGATALVFFALSGYVLTTGKDFSFLGGFLFIGLMVALIGGLGMIVAGMFGVNISGFSIALSAMIVFLMSGFILYDTSRIIHGGETNYLLATIALYLDIVNLFTALLHLIGVFGGDD